MNAPVSPSFPNGLVGNRSLSQVQESMARANAEMALRKVQDAKRAAAEASRVFKLVDEKTGKEIALPARRTCWDGAEIVVREFKPSRFEGNQGYIYTNLNETFVPSVIGAKIVEAV